MMIHKLTGTSLAALGQASISRSCKRALGRRFQTRYMSALLLPDINKIGFVGLGNMGLPMCLNLKKKSEKCTIIAFDMNELALDAAEKGGIQCTSSLDEIGQSGCDLIFTMLPGDDAVHQVMPILMKSWPCILVDCSTVSPTTSRHWHSQVAAAEGGELGAFLDAPVSGGVKGAQDATLTFMVGGEDHMLHSPSAALEAVRPFFELMGKRVIHCGGPGTGAATKLCNNLALACQMIGVCEALNLGEALGVDPVVLASVMNTSTAKSWSTDVCIPHPVVAANMKETTGVAPPASRDYEGGFGTKLMLKDLGLAVAAGEKAGVALPLGAVSKELYRMADLRGLGKKDFGVMLQFLRGNDV
jgi:3-hydroxyisobutyrate dehydrogenase